MGTVFISCPATGKRVSTGIEIERRDFLGLPNVPSKVFCPSCSQTHAWLPADADLRASPARESPLIPGR